MPSERTVTVLDPSGHVFQEDVGLARRLDDLAGQKVGLLDDGLAFSDAFLARIGELLEERAYAKRRQMGLESLEPIIVPGIMGSREEARGMADGAYAGVVEWLRRGAASRERRAEAAVEPKARAAGAER